MKIYVIGDMEGISGIVLDEQVTIGTEAYREARALYIGDVNAAVSGALETGANEVIVCDNHYRGFHFPLDRLHPRARYVMGYRRYPRFPFIEGSAGVFLVGYHAMCGTSDAVRDHTVSPEKWSDFWLNDRKMGEVGIDSAIVGYQGVPVMLVTGDDKVCAEAVELLGEIETAEVKQSAGRNRALITPPTVAQEIIRERAARAVQRIGEVPPLQFEGPVEIRLRLTSTDLAEAYPIDGEQIVRIDGRTVLVRGRDLMDALRFV